MVAPAPFPWPPCFLAGPGHNSQLPEKAGALPPPCGTAGARVCVVDGDVCVFCIFSPPRSCICVDVLFSGSWKGECLTGGSRPPLPKGCSLVLGDQGSSKVLFLLRHSSQIPRNPSSFPPTPILSRDGRYFLPTSSVNILHLPLDVALGACPSWSGWPLLTWGLAERQTLQQPALGRHTRSPAAPASQAQPACPAQA